MNEKLQDLLDTVQRTAVRAADTACGAGRKAGELLSTARLRLRIATLEGRVEGCLAEVGEMIYATHTGNPTPSDALLEKLQEIDDLKFRIAALEDEASLGRTVCPSCGITGRPGDQFCRNCGTRL